MTIKNPYVGPRPFQEDESSLFFGRDREARDLCALVTSVKLVLFYAQSGAGKSSLINTRLILELKERGYEVLPVARVGGDAPQGFKTTDLNIYIYNLMHSLIKREVKSNSLVGLSLSEFLAKLNKYENEYFYDSNLTMSIRASEDFVLRRVLIIDQFEELFSSHPEAWQSREGFFNQLAQAMQDDPSLWVVLVMREDYIASLDPYVHLLPGGLRTHYYMQRLDKDRAIEAVEGPATTQGHLFAPGVAEKLFDDLSRIQVRKLDGTFEPQTGQYVEPVQLQVICHTLWKNLFPEGKNIQEGIQITEKDLKKIGDVNLALGNFYAARVQEVAEAKGIKERKIREWFTSELISPSGMRNMVLQEPDGNSAGLENEIIQALHDLIRPEQRGGATFYELTHDRMVQPIIENNREWNRDHSSPFRTQAEEWEKRGKRDRYLITGQVLRNAELWKKQHSDQLTDLEKEFLEVCQSRQRRNFYIALVATLILLIVVGAVGFAFSTSNTEQQTRKAYMTAQAANTKAVEKSNEASTAQALAENEKARAVQEQQKAEVEANRALAGNLVAQADSIKNNDYTLALLLAMEAYHRDPNLLTRTTLFELLQFTPYKREFGFDGPVSSVAISPDGTLLAVASCTGQKTKQCTIGNIKLYNADMKEISGPPLFNHELGPVYTLAFSSDGKTLAAGGCVPSVPFVSAGCAENKGQITFWDVSSPNNPEFLSDTSDVRTKTGYIHTALVKTVAFSPDGEWLASGSYDTTIIVWNIRDLYKPSFSARLKRHFSFVNGLAFSPDGNTLVSASDDKHIWLWNFSRKNGDANDAPPGHTAPINSIAFSQNGTKFASAADDNTVLLWAWDAKQGLLQDNPIKLEGHAGYVKSVVFNDDGTILASAGFDNKIILWNASTGQQIGLPLSVHSGAVNSLAFGSQNLEGKISPYLISGGDDHTVIRWDLSARLSASQPVSQTVLALPDDKQDHGKLKDKLLKAVANEDRTVTLSDVTEISQPDTFLKLEGFNGAVAEPYFSRDAKYLYTVERFGESKRVTQWEIDPDDWLKDMACIAVKQNLTPLTKKTFLDIVPTQSVLEMCDIKMAVQP